MSQPTLLASPYGSDQWASANSLVDRRERYFVDAVDAEYLTVAIVGKSVELVFGAGVDDPCLASI